MRFATKKSGKAKDLEREALRVITKSCVITPKEVPSPLSTVWCVVVVSIKETSGVLKVLLENVIRDAVTYTEHSKRKAFTVMDFIYALKRQLSPYKFYTLLRSSIDLALVRAKKYFIGEF